MIDSIEANTCEEMTIHNVNEKMAEVARQVGEYLQKALTDDADVKA